MDGFSLVPGITEGGAIILAVLGLLTAVVTVIGGKIVGSVRGITQSVKVVREQVQNGHTTNMREESDERHDSNSLKLDRVLKWAESVDGRLHRMDTRLLRMEGSSDSHEGRLDDLEDTLNPRRDKK